MNVKKIQTVAFGLICVLGLAYYTYNILNEDKNSSSELIDFAIKDTAMVTKIRITDPFQESFEISIALLMSNTFLYLVSLRSKN